ncbi:unnamed protein product [Choristocarpus tenellus]
MSNPGLQGRRTVISTGQSREAFFYELVAGCPDTQRLGYSPGSMAEALTWAKKNVGEKWGLNIPPSLLPGVIYTHTSPLFGEFVILMEDMAIEDSTRVNKIFGDKIWFSEGQKVPDYDPLAALEAIFSMSADIHARHWQNKWLLKSEQNWLKGSAWYAGQGRTEWELAMQFGRSSWERAKRRFGCSSSGECGILAGSGKETQCSDNSDQVFSLSSKLVRIVDESFALSSWKLLQAHLCDPSVPWTLCHGDFHASNMFAFAGLEKSDYSHGGIGLALCDWSEVGPWEPMTDLAQLAISDLSPSLLLKHGR